MLQEFLQVDGADLGLAVGEVGDGAEGVEGHARLGDPLVALGLLVKGIDEQDRLARAARVEEAFHVDEVEAHAVTELTFERELRQPGGERDVRGVVTEAS